MTRSKGRSKLPPPLDQAAYRISPELALVDRDLADLGRAEHVHEPLAQHAPCGYLEPDARAALNRICDLSDVNPPRQRRARLPLAVGVPAVLWAEAVLLVASLLPFGAL
jgi:hypothetical protein